MPMYFSLLLVLAFGVRVKGLHVHGPSSPVMAHLGGTILLPCFAQNPVFLDGLQVEWRKMDSESLVNVFQQGKTRTDLQSQSFRGRVDFFPAQLSKGNFSILLKNVVQEDAGVYRCKVNTANNTQETVVEMKTVGLHVDGPPNPVMALIGGTDNPMGKSSDQIILASAGDEVILNCSVDSHQPVHEIEEVTWKKKDLLVLLFQDNKTFSDSSHESYRGRAEFFITEIPKGNFSLKLKDVRMEDKGEFICEIHTSNISTRTIVDLQSIGFSVLHILILLLCIAALLITVGFGFPAFKLLRKKVTTKTGLIIQATLMICPNICMCVAFILWSQEGFPLEVAICSAVCIARPIMLIKISPYLINMLPDCLQKTVKTMAVPLHHLIIMTAAFSILFDDFQGLDKGDIIYKLTKTTFALFAVVCFISAVISAGFGLRMLSTLLLQSLNGLLLALFVFGITGQVDLIIRFFSVIPPLVVALMLVLFLQRHYCKGKRCKCIHIVLSSLFVVLYSLTNITAYVIISLGFADFTRVWILLLEAVMYIIGWLAVILLVRFHREHMLPQLRGKGYLCCAVIASVPIIVIGILCLHYTAQLKRKDVAGNMALTVFVNVLAPTSLFKHPKHLPDFLQVMICIFGAVGVAVLNSIALASALICKAEKGVHIIEDLRLIVLPFETLFASGWLALQMYDAWIRNKDRIKRNFEKEAEPEDFPELEPLPANTNQPT